MSLNHLLQKALASQNENLATHGSTCTTVASYAKQVGDNPLSPTTIITVKMRLFQVSKIASTNRTARGHHVHLADECANAESFEALDTLDEDARLPFLQRVTVWQSLHNNIELFKAKSVVQLKVFRVQMWSRTLLVTMCLFDHVGTVSVTTLDPTANDYAIVAPLDLSANSLTQHTVKLEWIICK
ncbi:Aste57867_2444 [Aphanomyces stellatus]|uniref:Aste57867_2444 protein n=1 Tax=Aphanomyces stellatus TaxID=120398 RepID=A0A485KD94_9STRA|nr:hypothetical protein As57867_002438 [Aphanomyces stellatus]VFT79644.1 Aste57867_2444 [Aphanomyces stellatus]